METTTSIQHEIEEIIRAFEAAFARHDADALASLYTADGQILPPGTDAVTGTNAIRDFWSGAFDLGIDRVDLETLEVHACGTMAVEVARVTMFGQDEEVMDRGKYVVLWKHVDGVWKLHRDIWNSSLPPAA
ncbi:MAG TPA: SgcJ/EcaC family oxidoreductase [Rhodothermales bacterium]|nr:SgcJ/EcaC family oxidoreductase [Rhodothermales bacterium]